MKSNKTPDPQEPLPSQQLRLDQIYPSKLQPRSYFDPEKMAELTESVKQYGVMYPIIVRPIGSDRYEVVAGERRYKAAKAVGLTHVPVTIREMNDTQALHCALMENLQRDNLNPIEETEGILQLLELNLETDRESVISLLNRMAKVERGLADNVIRPQEQAAISSVFQTLGGLTAESFRTNRLPLLNQPPDVLKSILDGEIKYSKGRVIGRIKDPEIRAKILQEAITESLSLNQIKQRIKAQQETEEAHELQARLEAIPKQMKKLKLWNDPHKREQAKSLLKQLEMLLSD
ncbi:ParB/RepB/Spo0J family partition protein [Limnospira indica]|uniref:ParB/RepB/Spo0J family partition protein n=1 Tax=Limnospira indica TaxID=147322 RepID=UPI001862C232|nr:ParB/RepB/Spo0J family partition protein [Limnospira indica]QNH57966.1 MAG: ParB/RepB/Spo0J family partition protein [Limnospira indica BM01]